MTYSHLDPAMQNRVSWNAGRTVGTKRPLTQKQVWAIRFFLDRENRLRDRALFDLAIDSKLRGCDLVKLKIGDLVAGSEVRDRAMIIQRKTGRPGSPRSIAAIEYAMLQSNHSASGTGATVSWHLVLLSM